MAINIAITGKISAELANDLSICDRVIEIFQDMLKDCSKVNMPRYWADIQSHLADTLRMQGNLAPAAEAYRRALEILRPEGTPVRHLEVARVLGATLLKQGGWREVVETLERLLSSGVVLVLAEPTQRRQQVLLERLAGVGDDLAFARLNLATPDSVGAVAALGQGRGIVLSLTAAIAGLADRPDLRDARMAWRRAQGMVDRAQERERRMESAVAAGTTDSAQLEAVRTEAATARAAVRDTFNAFTKVVQEVGLDQPEAVDISELGDALPESGALVMPVIPSHGEDCVLILTAGRREPEVVPLRDLTSDWVGERLREWFAGYAAFRNSAVEKDGRVGQEDVDAWNEVMTTVLTEVGRVLIAPIDQYLDKKLRLAVGHAEAVLMLPGRLSVLPLHAAPVNAEGQVFLDHWIVSQIANPQMLLAAQRARGRPLGSPSLLGITNPTGDLKLRKVNPQGGIEEIEILANPALPYFSEGDRKDLAKAAATVSKTKEELPRHTHACYYGHAGWDWAAPERSGCELHDGRLTVGELRELALGVSRFVMLAGCETALPDVNRIPDEFTSLAMVAAAEAGIPCVAASLWTVPGEPTYTIVEDVFRRHITDGMAPPAALRAAQLTQRARLETNGRVWRFPVRADILGGGTPRSTPDATTERATQLERGPVIGPPAEEPVPDLFAWAGFACYGG